MRANIELAGDWQVEIWFPIEKDQDGYPQSKNWEQLLARPLLERNDYFVIESVPFFLKNVCRGDVISAKALKNKTVLEGEGFEYNKLVKTGGHNTYRLLLRRKHPEDPKFTEDELMHKGLAVEIEGDDFFAVDVPPSVDQKEIDQYLVGEARAGRWEMQDGCLQTIIAHPRMTYPK
jgi:hypothetical protein